MRKYISIILSAAIITGISGCMSRASAPNTPAEENHSTREEIKPTAEPSAEAPETAEAPGQTTESLTDTKETLPESSSDVVLLDFDGTLIDTTDASTYSVYDSGYWKDYTFDGFAWLAEPRGLAVVSPDGSVPDIPEVTPAQFKRYKIGDTICGLTLTKAETIIETQNNESYFNGCRVEFDGTAEITGYVYYATETVFLEDEGDLSFVPTAEGCTLPVLHYGAVIQSLSTPFETYYNDVKWGNEYDRIFALGNSADYSGEDWLSLIPQDGTPVKIKATVDNIKAEYLRDSHKSGNGYYRAVIQSLELV